VIYDTNDKNKDSVFPSFNIKWDMGSKKWDMGYSGCPTLIQRVSHFVTEVFPISNIKWDMGSKKWDMGYSGCPTLIQRVSHFVTEVFPIPYQKQTNNMHMDVLVTNEISSI
jgi:hypothetical protein